MFILVWQKILPAQIPDNNPIQHLWNELKPHGPTPVVNLTNIPVAELEQILAESLLRGVEAADKDSQSLR